jgi:hypothetical protein
MTHTAMLLPSASRMFQTNRLDPQFEVVMGAQPCVLLIKPCGHAEWK